MKNLKTRFIMIVLSCYIIFLLFLLSSGSIKKFINPRLSFLTGLAVLILGAMFFHNLTQIGRHSNDEDDDEEHRRHAHEECDCCGHHPKEEIKISSYLLFLPILLSLVIAPKTLGYSMDSNQSSLINQMNQVNMTRQIQPFRTTSVPEGNNAPAQQNSGDDNVVSFIPAGKDGETPSQDGKPKEGQKDNPIPQQLKIEETTDYTELQIGDIIFDTLKAPQEKLLGSHIGLIGKVYHSSKLQPDEIVVYRIVISCCAADGLPLGVIVKLPQKMNLPNESWIRVEGSVKLLTFNEKLKDVEPAANMVTPEKIYPYFTATDVYSVDAPQDEYLYPY